jgi:hypothetical protein
MPIDPLGDHSEDEDYNPSTVSMSEWDSEDVFDEEDDLGAELDGRESEKDDLASELAYILQDGCEEISYVEAQRCSTKSKSTAKARDATTTAAHAAAKAKATAKAKTAAAAAANNAANTASDAAAANNAANTASDAAAANKTRCACHTIKLIKCLKLMPQHVLVQTLSSPLIIIAC